MIHVFQPTVGDEELAAVAKVFESNWLGRGPRTGAFEEAFAEHLGVGPEHVMTVNSCTEALFLSMELAEVGPGDDVVLPSISFVGAGNAIAARGARPVLCDVDPRTLNPTVANIEASLTPATRAVILLHYGGYPGEVQAIAQLCRERDILLVEDAACSVASRVDGTAAGTLGDMGVWSFGASKIVVTGDGGMLYAKDPELIERARKQAYFGLEQFSGYSQAQQTSTRWWDFQISSFSRRSIMNDIQSAIGIVQLERLKDFIARRREIAARYDEALAGAPGLLAPPPLPAGHDSSYYLYWVQMAPEIRDEVARDLYDHDIYTTFRYAPLHEVEAYGWTDPLPHAASASAGTLCLPIHQAMSDADVDTTVAALTDAVRRLDPAATTGDPR